ncbi:DNA-binding protein [Sulfurovum riftiae]|uniref:DNA-binding protein n=1 Tax=Sulfurovum riftiae TaxID=1630136 RepID=A0A151CDI2_9BACT|nr:DNA-binding protein [Sulfurovum riftiae]KYJ85578.1 DNA-binding protein [Sulfurovum riftiae]
MKTITLKTDDTFFDKVNTLAKQLHLTKSELIRRSVAEYEIHIKKKAMKEQMREASLRVREANDELVSEFERTVEDGLKDV